jgi:methyl-accepting chemotaxis protein
MANLIGNLRLWQKILLIVGAFVLPFGVLAFFTFQAYDEHIGIARLELEGTAMIRPMADLLDQLNAHELLNQQYRAGLKQFEGDITKLQKEIDQSFAAVAAQQRVHGAPLQFTPEGLKARGRGHAWIETVQGEWNLLKQQWTQLPPDQSRAQHDHLIKDVQDMIAHVGDTSTLVLDPALDSYYLMDVAVFVMPVVQERLIQIVSRGLPLVDEVEGTSVLDIAGLNALLRDSDLPRLVTDVATAVREDAGNFGTSPTLARALPPKMDAFKQEADALIAQAVTLSAGGKDISHPQYVAAGKRTQDTALALWKSTFDELDVLLVDREHYWTNRRFRGSAFTGGALVLSTLLAWIVVIRVSRPLRRLTEAANAAAHQGDLSHVLVSEDGDEVGHLTRAFAAMTERFRNVVGVAEKLAEGDLAVQVMPLSEKDSMGHALERMVGNLNTVARLADELASGDLRVEVRPLSSRDVMGQALAKMVTSLSTLTGQVQKAAIIMNSSVTDIAATARQQQATTSEVAATTTEIGATSKEIHATSKELLKTVSEVSSGAEDTATLANSGQTSLGRMEDTMGHFVEAVTSINGKLAVLSEKAANINQVVTTITKVADQTNLLSLNAAIEAEKAGEYGRGFAVVATEIRRLADQTAVASHDIEQMVKEMQSAVAAGVMGMDKFGEQVRRGVQEVQQVSSQLGQIIHHVQALTPRVLAVNEGMQAQATGADQITQALSQLVDATQQTADSLRQSNVSIEQLHDASRGMLNSLDGFKLRPV